MLRSLLPFLLASTALAQDTPTDAFVRDLQAIVPAAAEQGWLAVPWRTALGAAMVEASAAGKPVLLWAMNGHPLGQT